MAAINIGSENASDVFYRCVDERGWTGGWGEAGRETGAGPTAVFFSSFSPGAPCLPTRHLSRRSGDTTPAPASPRPPPSHARTSQVQDAPPAGQGEWEREKEAGGKEKRGAAGRSPRSPTGPPARPPRSLHFFHPSQFFTPLPDRGPGQRHQDQRRQQRGHCQGPGTAARLHRQVLRLRAGRADQV